jgi:hypothetical protein
LIDAIVIAMASTTTIAIAPATRDALRGLAAERGDTMDSLIVRLLRDERARRMDEVADEIALIAGSGAVVAREIG